MCSFCYTKLLADATMEELLARCPVCRDELDDVHVQIRSLVAESVLAELITECPSCSQEVKRGELMDHEANKCSERYEMHSICVCVCVTYKSRKYLL